MKKIFNILMAAIIAGATFTSCDDDDTKWTGDGTFTLPVISRQTEFPAAASSGTIVVDTTDPVTVTSSDQGWVTTTVSDNTITVNVDENTSLNSRTSVLTIKAGDKMTEVSVIQSGLIFDMGGVLAVSGNDDEATYTFPIKANAPIEVTTDADWCQASVVDGALAVTMQANNTGHIRRCNVSYTIGTISDEIPVTQCELEKDIEGTWIFAYTAANGKQGATYGNIVTDDEGNPYLVLYNGQIVFPLLFNASTATLSIKNMQYCGNWVENGTTYYLHTLMYDISSGYITYSPSVGMAAPVEYDILSDGTPVSLAIFEDDGIWGSHSANTIFVEMFTSRTTVNSTTDTEDYVTVFINPYLLREEAAAASEAVSMKAVTMSRTMSPADLKVTSHQRNTLRID